MHLDNVLYLSLSVTNVAAGSILAYTQLRYYRVKEHSQWSWVKLGLGLIGVYWAVLYVFVILQTLGIIQQADPVWFGRIFVRPALTITLGLIAAGGLMRWKNGNYH